MWFGPRPPHLCSSRRSRGTPFYILAYPRSGGCSNPACFSLHDVEYRTRHRSPLPHLPAGRHPHLLHGTALADQIDRVVEVHRAADVVRDDPQGVTHLEVVLRGHGEHPVLLGEPLERGTGIPYDVAEPL